MVALRGSVLLTSLLLLAVPLVASAADEPRDDVEPPDSTEKIQSSLSLSGGGGLLFPYNSEPDEWVSAFGLSFERLGARSGWCAEADAVFGKAPPQWGRAFTIRELAFGGAWIIAPEDRGALYPYAGLGGSFALNDWGALPNLEARGGLRYNAASGFFVGGEALGRIGWREAKVLPRLRAGITF